MAVLLGMAATVIDVGSWYRAQRQSQLAADAAALVAAGALPNTNAASAAAIQYGSLNGRSITAADLSFSTRTVANDTVTVRVQTNEPTFFARIFGMDSVKVRVAARALSGVPASTWIVAPITIGVDNPQLQCGALCYGKPIQLVALPNGNYNGNMTNFALVDLSNRGGNVTATTLSQWLMRGYPGSISLGNIDGATASMFNSPEFQAALTAKKGQSIVVLVHDQASGNEGVPGAKYNMIGWAGFVITSWSGSGASATLNGYFTSVTIGGTPTTNPQAPDYGVHTVNLIR